MWTDDFTVQMSIASVRSVGKGIAIDMGAHHPTYGNNPPWRVRVAYHWCTTVDASWPMFDDQRPSGCSSSAIKRKAPRGRG
jgi:hypothetical protein